MKEAIVEDSGLNSFKKLILFTQATVVDGSIGTPGKTLKGKKETKVPLGRRGNRRQNTLSGIFFAPYTQQEVGERLTIEKIDIRTSVNNVQQKPGGGNIRTQGSRL